MASTSTSETPYERMAEVQRQEYHAVSGTSFPEARSADPVISQQPSSVTGVESYVLDLDATQVASECVFALFTFRLNGTCIIQSNL